MNDDEQMQPSAGPSPAQEEATSSLRGASVEVDRRRVVAVLVVVVVVCLAGLSIALLIAGIQRNNQINELRDHGVPVEATVTSCLGLMGGSGSNGAGYVCKARYEVDGTRYVVTVPNDTLYAPGTHLHGLVVDSDPSVFSTADIVAGEHPSDNVFIAPAILFVVLIALLVGLVLLRRRLTS